MDSTIRHYSSMIVITGLDRVMSPLSHYPASLDNLFCPWEIPGSSPRMTELFKLEDDGIN